MLSAGQHPDHQSLIVEGGRGDRGAVAAGIGADAENASALGLGHHRGVHLWVVGGGDGVPGAVEVAAAVVPQGQGDARPLKSKGFHRRGGRPGDDVDVGTVRDENRHPALRHRAATDHDDLLTGQAQADQVGVLAHLTSLMNLASLMNPEEPHEPSGAS